MALEPFNLIQEISNFVTDDELLFLNTSCQQYLSSNSIEFNNVIDGFGNCKQNREGQTFSISSIGVLKELDDIIFKKLNSDKLKETISNFFNPNLIFGYGDSGYEFHRYHPGQICKVHSDGEFVVYKDNSKSLLRFASVVLHLNTCTDGGELVFPILNKTVKTEAGKLVIFPPHRYAKHYTTPSIETRDVIVTWLVYNNTSVNYVI